MPAFQFSMVCCSAPAPCNWRNPRQRPLRKGRPAALAASPFPQRAAMREKGSGEAAQGVVHSVSSMVLSKGMVMARFSRSAKPSSRSSSCVRLPRSREKRPSM